jgi:hypothetical protein
MRQGPHHARAFPARRRASEGGVVERARVPCGAHGRSISIAGSWLRSMSEVRASSSLLVDLASKRI